MRIQHITKPAFAKRVLARKRGGLLSLSRVALLLFVRDVGFDSKPYLKITTELTGRNRNHALLVYWLGGFFTCTRQGKSNYAKPH